MRSPHFLAGGSGLGLSIIWAIVERHGGTVSLHNEGGAVFDILLPRADNAMSSEDDETDAV